MILFSFPSAEKKQNAAAAPDAINVNALAWTMPAAPAEAEKTLTVILCSGQSLRSDLSF
jgi:hypothetical protein